MMGQPNSTFQQQATQSADGERAADLAYLEEIRQADFAVTMRSLVQERSPHAQLPGYADEPLLKLGTLTLNDMQLGAARYLRLGAKERKWEEAWKQVADNSVYVFTDDPGDYAVGKDATTERLRAQLAYVPYATFRVLWIHYYHNRVEFYILNEFRPKGWPADRPPMVIANYSVLWASHVDPRTGLLMFNGFRDMYDKVQFELLILAYLKADLEGGGDASVKFLKAGGRQLLKQVPDWLHQLVPGSA